MAAGNGERGHWKTRTGFILAAAGSAVGLGNIWKFPYITGENGGGLFVLIYLVCIALVGVPIMMSEIMIGRAAQKQPVAAFHALQGKKTAWAGVGWFGVLAGFVILSYYIVVAGWAMDFTLKSVANFTEPIHKTAQVEATTYRATEDIVDMRAMLVDRWTDRESKDEVALIRREVKPSAWEAYDRFTAAVASAGSGEHASAVLLEDDELREGVEEVEAVQPRIETAKTDCRQAAIDHYATFSDKEIRDEATTVIRRNSIYDAVNSAFGDVASDGWTTVFWAAIFMMATILIVAGGVGAGIERTCRVLMPTLFVLILVMVVYGAFKPGFGEAVSFVFKPDPHKLKASGVLEALGHAFFTLSLGMGAMITYGSYQKSKAHLAGQSATIAVLDTGIALLACLMIFPITFSYGQEPDAGPGLVFKSMPLAFAEIGKGGMLLAIMFFGLVVFAALTSAISLLEVVASYFIDERNWPRRRAAWILGCAIFLFGIPSAFSNDPGFAMSGWEPSFGINFFDTMDYLASNWMLPLGGLFIAVYAGWFMPKKMRDAELQGISPLLVMGWFVLIRFLAPVLVIIVLAQKVGILDADELLHGLF
ncbi:MAG: sodium-dependent transporter [Phycisphaerales bacterium]|nr:sodium-dependent transporter [Phycisphaerales bacterium]